MSDRGCPFPKWAPPKIVSAYSEKNIKSLFDWQAEVLEFAEKNDDNNVFCAPTSAGKSIVAELIALRATLSGKRVLFLLPYISVAKEKLRFLQIRNQRTKTIIMVCISYQKATTQYRSLVGHEMAGVHQLAASLKHGGITQMLNDGISADELAVVAMLRMFNEKKRWNINICNIYLKKLKDFLLDNTLPEICRQVALSSLQCTATSLLDSLRSCARAPLSSIGVDVAAEERKEKAENCLKELRDLRDRREQFYRRLCQEDVGRLDAIMVFLKPL